MNKYLITGLCLLLLNIPLSANASGKAEAAKADLTALLRPGSEACASIVSLAVCRSNFRKLDV